jgi:hypothetical protein
MGGAGFSAGRIGQAFSLAHQGDFVLLPPPDTLQGPLYDFSFTFDAWVKFVGVASSPMTILDWPTQERTGWRLWRRPDGRLEFCAHECTASIAVSTARLDPGAWRHVAVVDRSGEVILYVDGRREAATTAPESVTDHPPAIYLGSTRGLSDFFFGAIDEAELYTRALTESELRALYDAGAKGQCPQPISVP